MSITNPKLFASIPNWLFLAVMIGWLVIYLILQIYGVATLIAYTAHVGSPLKVQRNILCVYPS